MVFLRRKFPQELSGFFEVSYSRTAINLYFFMGVTVSDFLIPVIATPFL